MKRVLMRSGVAVLACVMTAVIGLISYVTVTRTTPTDSAVSEGQCESGSARQLHGSIKLAVDKSERYDPRIVSDAEFKLPVEAAHLVLLAKDDERRQRFLGCLLGIEPGQVRDYERSDLLNVELRDDQVHVKSRSYADFAFPARFDGMVGFAKVKVVSHDEWSVAVQPSASLSDATELSISIKAPPGWLSSPNPAPIRASAEEYSWRLSPHAYFTPTLLVHPDYETSTSDLSNQGPWNVIPYWLTLLVLAGAATWLMLRGNRKADCRRDCIEGGKPGGPFWIILSVLMVVLTLTFMQIWDRTIEAFVWQPDWLSVNFAESFLVVPLAALVAFYCGAGYVIPAVLCFSQLAGYALLASVLPGGSDTIRLTDNVALSVTVQAVAAILFCATVFSAVVFALKSLWLDSRISALTCWLISFSLAFVVVLERIAINEWIIGKEYSRAAGVPGPMAHCCPLNWFSLKLLDQMSWGLLSLVALALWSLFRSGVVEMKSRLPDWHVAILLAMLTCAAAKFEVDVYSWWVPIWILFYFGLRARIRKSDSVLGCRDSVSSEALRAAALGVPRGELYENAIAWRKFLAEMRASERGGSHAGSKNAEGAVVGYSDWNSEQATPVDVLLAVGPSAEPRQNAAIAAKYTVVMGIPATGLITWQEWRRYSPLPPDYSTSIILRGVIDVAGGITGWLIIGFVIGALWQQLPGKSGPTRVLPFLLAFLAMDSLDFAVEWLVYDIINYTILFSAAVTFLVIATLGLAMDFKTVAAPERPWQSPLQMLTSIYRIENFKSQVTFFLAQVAALLAIVGFLTGQGDAPSYPNVDPQQIRGQQSSIR